MKKFNLKWLLLSFILSIASINTASADTKRVYCKMTQSWWTNGDATGGASIGAYAWKSSDASQKNAAWPGVRMTWTERDGEWYIDLDTKYDKVIFTRVNSAPNALEDWGAKTSDLSVSEGNYYTITTSTSTWSPSTCSGSWKTVSKPSVTLTIEKVSTDQITLCGTITSGGNDGTNASDMIEVGFKIGATTYNSSITKSGTSFRKTITGLSANTTYSNIKAYATNVVGTTETSAQSATTLANTTYRIQVQVAHGGTAPKIYAWRADDYGGNNTEKNAAYASSPAMSLLFAASTYDWYYYDMHNKYDKFLLKNNNSNDNGKTADILTPREAKCYWYTDSNGNYGEMDCPSLTPQLIIKAKGAGSDTRVDMSGDGTKTVDYTLSAGTTYLVKIMYNTEYYGKGDSDESSAIARTGSTSSNSISGLAVGKSYIKLTADLGGTYTFNFNTSGNVLSVTYPTAYQITYSATTVGSGTGNSAAPTATYNSGATSVTSGTTWIPTGTTVAFSAKSANAGYTFKGWYSDTPNPANWSTNLIQEGAAYNRVVSATATIYAVYDENDYTVTITKTTGGSIASTSVTGHKTTLADLPTATADDGYYFTGWTTTAGTLTNSSSATTGKINGLTSTATVTANFAPIWSVASTATSPEYATGVNLIENISSAGDPAVYTGYKDITLAANTDYQFQIVDRRGSSTWYGHVSGVGAKTEIGYADDNTAVNAATGSYNNFTLHTAAAGTYRFYWSWNSTTKQVKVDFPTSWQITIGQKTIYDPDVTNTSDATTTGGNVTAVDNSSNTITSGKYVANSASVTFTAHPAAGYAFKGWYKNADCSTPYAAMPGVVIDDEAKTLTLSSIAADKVVYAKFEEIMTQISLLVRGTGQFKIDGGSAISEYGSPWLQVGVHTTHTVSIAPESTGHYFARWDLSAANEESLNFSISGDKDNEDNRTITVTGLGRAGSSLNFIIPVFGELDKIYFRNNFDDGTNPATHWSNVYVFFDVSWDGSNNRAVTSSVNSSETLHVAMTDSEYRNIWWAYVPRYATRYTKTKVAFASYDQSGDSYGFYPGSGDANHGYAVYREDYNRKLNMFVPYHTKTSTSNNTDYFSNGYWMQYTISAIAGDSAGYYIERKTGTNTYTREGGFTIISKPWEDPTIQCNLRIDAISKDKYIIRSAGNIKYKANTTITSGACTDVTVVEDNTSDSYFTLTPTSEGEYVITINQSGDQMKISVNYPIAEGDYILENVYNDGSSKTTHSNVIKAAKAGEKTRYSMFLSNAGSGTLKLRKCTNISNTGVVTWSEGDASSVAAIMTAVGSKPGVYQFDLTVNTSSDVASEIDSIRLYTGNYYIKTDAARGGWTAYKENAMEKNTVNFDRTSATFDNYWCKYFGDGTGEYTNIKCVIANDYCNQLSDTLKQDKLGIAYMDGTEPKVPIDGTSIRFSYNSATNTIDRAYLGASLNKDYLNIVPNATGYVYKTDGTTDLYGKTGDGLWDTWFKDNGDWVYEIDVKVYPGAKAGVTATYNTSHVQTLLPSDNVVLGGTKATTKYEIRVVYDFKTNYMMSAFILPEDPITEELHDFDMLWVRHQQNSATQVQLGVGGKLENVRVIGALEFKYDEMCSSSGTAVDLSRWNGTSRPYLKYYVSFPFDVEMNSIFGLNQPYYSRTGDFVIQKYNGARRAKEGLFYGDDANFWEDVQMGDTLHANEGYCVILDNFYASSSIGMWKNKKAGSSTFLYFPAMETIEEISVGETTTTVAKHTCNIDRTFTVEGKEKNHKITDSHWNMIGNPLFHDAYVKSFVNSGDSTLKSYYVHDLTDDFEANKWEAQTLTTGSDDFKAMSCVLVQWCGTITWTKDGGPYAAPKRKTNEDKNYLVHLDIWYNESKADQTFVRLEEDADADFVLREDMCKILSKRLPNIYTFAGNYDVAYNEMPMENCTVPVGVVARKNGTYTFSMPDNFSGTVTLIDTYTQTRTNLALDDYEVYLEKGTIADRFELEININKTPTAIDGAGDGSGSLKDGKAHKFIENGVMYILENGRIYDAQGNRVK